MSAIGTKQTSLVAPHMSAFGGKADIGLCAARFAFDPKRTWPLPALLLNPIRWPVLSLGGGNETARVHQFTQRRGSRVAIRGAREQAGRLPTVGFLGADALVWGPWTAAFVGRLRELGWIEGRTIVIEYRWISEGK